MKKIFNLLLVAMLVCLTAVSVYAVPESATVVKDTYVNAAEDNYEVAYTVILPTDYKETEYYPVLLFLHGAGERGNDNVNQLNLVIDDLFATRPELLENTIIIAPQCPTDDQWVNTPWENGNYSVDEIPESKALKTALKILDEVSAAYGGDRAQTYIMGISMGGYGTWMLSCVTLSSLRLLFRSAVRLTPQRQKCSRICLSEPITVQATTLFPPTAPVLCRELFAQQATRTSTTNPSTVWDTMHGSMRQ